MNVDPQIGAIIIAIISGVGGWYANKSKKVSSNEAVYADHTKDLWKRLDKLTHELDDTKTERDSLRIKVNQLQSTVDGQSKTIEAQTKQIEELKNSVDLLRRHLG
ncbi:uroporphyrinogen-III C-methyltransferase [Ligilactobacillus acidipiscis]|uniref:Uncharacterized protein n=1 Tax=Ligilactobacillus acidipiscis TaxID=89059 RepID=A0A0R2KFK1_9LACO|nr:uroporphyrinogen-III C-methyltransferase [Ligilactobacillus acidipiscis]KRN88208.1 hypothetical protein IV43_GL000059 [Ligilactobacillus acidipiscis]